jgi:hypothetical protein
MTTTTRRPAAKPAPPPYRTLEQQSLATIPGLTHVDYSKIDLRMARELTTEVATVAMHFGVPVHAIAPTTWSGFRGQTFAGVKRICAPTFRVNGVWRTCIAYVPAGWTKAGTDEYIAWLRGRGHRAACSKNLRQVARHETMHAVWLRAPGYSIRVHHAAAAVFSQFTDRELRAIIGDYPLGAKPTKDDDQPVELAAEVLTAWWEDPGSLGAGLAAVCEEWLTMLYPAGWKRP